MSTLLLLNPCFAFFLNSDIISAAKDERFTYSSIVDSPNVTVTISDVNGNPVKSARIGDQLVLRFIITDEQSPYEIFVRSLVANDGMDDGEMELIGDDGCPIDVAIMGPVNRVKGNSKIMQTTFEAFKFPSSNIVNFRAIVTPCLAKCQPIHCYSEGFDGSTRASYSYGRRRRRAINTDQDLIVLQSIRIQDAFGGNGVDNNNFLYQSDQDSRKLVRSESVVEEERQKLDSIFGERKMIIFVNLIY